jgi:hypothetical protein
MSSAFGELALFSNHGPVVLSAPYVYAQGWNFITRPSSTGDKLSYTSKSLPGARSFSVLGFGYIDSIPPPRSVRIIYFPHWFAALLFAILPTVRLRSILRTRRENRIGLCQHCGYDLRATPDRCPECGAVAAKSLGARS